MLKAKLQFWIRIVLVVLTLFLSSNALAAKSMVDPSRIGVGARALGLGKAYLGIADDTNAIFLNPAGIRSIDQWMFTSMYSKLLGEIDYTQAGTIYPVKHGAIGIGWVGANIGGSYKTYRDPSTDRITMGEGAFSYSNNVVHFAYGFPLWWKKWSAGLDLKLFSQGISGTPEGTASGYDMDLGLMYKALPWLTFGLHQQNVLPDSMAKLTWGTGNQESIPERTKFGVAARRDKLLVGLDTEFPQGKRPTLFHLGFEWWPMKVAALRLGIDQDAVAQGSGSVGIDSNLTAGVGLRAGGFQFDYAYHQYSDLTENLTHFFSLSYVGIEKKATSMILDYILAEHPVDKLIVYKDTVRVRGRVLHSSVAEVYVNGVEVKLEADNTFETEIILLKAGKNTVQIVALDKNGGTLQVIKRRLLRLIAFGDVPRDYWAASVIEYTASLGLIGGYPDGNFRPEAGINRGELAALLVRATKAELPPLTKPPFKDVSIRHWAAKYVQAAKEQDLVGGYPDNTFRLPRGVTRAEGVTIVTRFDKLVEPTTIKETPFPDLPLEHWAAKAVTLAKKYEYLDFLKDKPFKASQRLSRAEAVEILSKTKLVGEKINELLDWDKEF